MKVRTFADAGSFLRSTRAELESEEAANSLMLGICMQLVRHPGWFKALPSLKAVHDENGLVLASVMTPPHKLVVYGHEGDLDGGARLLVEDLLGEGWAVPGVLGAVDGASRVAGAWAEITGQRSELEQRQMVYELRQVKSPVPKRGKLQLASEADAGLVARWRHGFYSEVFGEADRDEARLVAARHVAGERIRAGDVYLWQDQGPVSMAQKARPTRNGISVGLVYTPPELRGRGYASACVGELSRLLLESGWAYCALFANLANAAANRVYRRVGYEPRCEYHEYAFQNSTVEEYRL